MWEYYCAHARSLPWRQPGVSGEFSAYKIFVSEMMLQQTQVIRVVPKYQGFLERFPSLRSLSTAPLSEVIKAWSGLGYNRRAKYLWEASKILVGKAEPWAFGDLVQLPGIGPNTAAAILAYAYNQPCVFVETNIRTVFIHHFFSGQQQVADKDILELVESTLDRHNPREWYWALMDYGAYLKTSVSNLARASKAYAKQSRFAGSKRQIRGQVLRALGKRTYTVTELHELIRDERLPLVLSDLAHEGFITHQARSYKLV